MKEYLDISPVPYDEPCSQVGSPDYYEKMRTESKIFISQLKRRFPLWGEKNIEFVNKSFPHDFGSYNSVCVIFDDQDEEACQYAMLIENECPQNWDEIAKKELADYNQTINK